MALCDCGTPCIILTSWTDANPGRRFFSCPSQDNRCPRFLGWFDPPMCPRSMEIIPGLLRSKNRLEKELGAARAVVRRKDTLIYMLVILLGVVTFLLLAVLLA